MSNSGERLLVDQHLRFKPLDDAYPQILCREMINDSRFLIMDAIAPDEAREALTHIGTIDGRPFRLLDPERLSNELDDMVLRLIPAEAKKENVLIIFPGEGAKAVAQATKLTKPPYSFPTLYVEAKRDWTPGGTYPAATVVDFEPDASQRQALTIVVMDDAISSGGTLNEVRRKANGKFPRNAQWIAAAWTLQYPQNKEPSGLKGFASTGAPVVVAKEENGQKVRAALNSLSTLIKKPDVATNYAERHVIEADRPKFLEILGNLDKVRT